MPATLTMAPSGASEPLRPTTPPVGEMRIGNRIDDLLVGVELHAFEVLRDASCR